MSSLCYCSMPRLMGLQPCSQDSDQCSWQEAGRPAWGMKWDLVGLSAGAGSLWADRAGFLRWRSLQRVTQALGAERGCAWGIAGHPPKSPSRCTLQACPPGVFLQASTSRHALQASSSRCALQACPPGVPSRSVLQASSSRHALQVSSSRCTLQACPLGVFLQACPPGVPSRCALQACPPGVFLQARPPGISLQVFP